MTPVASIQECDSQYRFIRAFYRIRRGAVGRQPLEQVALRNSRTGRGAGAYCGCRSGLKANCATDLVVIWDARGFWGTGSSLTGFPRPGKGSDRVNEELLPVGFNILPRELFRFIFGAVLFTAHKECVGVGIVFPGIAVSLTCAQHRFCRLLFKIRARPTIPRVSVRKS